MEFNQCYRYPAGMSVCFGEVEEAASNAARDLGYSTLMPEQLQVVRNVLRGRNVFAVLPTVFEKNLCFSCLPFAYDQLYPFSKLALCCAGCHSVDSSHERPGEYAGI